MLFQNYEKKQKKKESRELTTRWYKSTQSPSPWLCFSSSRDWPFTEGFPSEVPQINLSIQLRIETTWLDAIERNLFVSRLECWLETSLVFFFFDQVSKTNLNNIFFFFLLNLIFFSNSTRFNLSCLSGKRKKKKKHFSNWLLKNLVRNLVLFWILN